MRTTTLAALAVLMAGPASAATVIFSGTVTSVEVFSETYDAAGNLTYSDTTTYAGGQNWQATFTTDGTETYLSWSLGDYGDVGNDAYLKMTATSAEGTGYFADYGSGGWDNESVDIKGQNNAPTTGTIFIQSGYDDGEGGYMSAVTYNLTGPAIAVPEPAAWAMMLVGFGLMGAILRQRRRANERTTIPGFHRHVP